MDDSRRKLDAEDWFDNPDEVRQKIIDAASALYAKKSFSAISLEEISEKASVTRTVTRYYVKTESEIVSLIMENLLNCFKENLIKKARDIYDPEKKLATAIDIYIRILDLQRDKALVIYQASKFLEEASKIRVMQLEVDVSNIFSKIITEGIEKGVFKEIDVDLMAYNIVMMAQMWALKRWHFKDRLSLDQYIELQLEIIRNALKS